MSSEILEKWHKNSMTKPILSKVTVNISVGKSGEPLEKASRILEELTSQKPYQSSAKGTIKDFGIRKGEAIACAVTLRGEKASNFLKKAIPAVEKIRESSFDDYGNFAFGIREHIEMPGVKYNPDLGIIGMDICVTLEKPGYRIMKKRRARSKIGAQHRVTPQESMCFIKEELGIEVTGEGDDEAEA